MGVCLFTLFLSSGDTSLSIILSSTEGRLVTCNAMGLQNLCDRLKRQVRKQADDDDDDDKKKPKRF